MRIGVALALWPMLLSCTGGPDAPTDDEPRAPGIYIPVKPMAQALSETDIALAGELPIYLHRHGGTYVGGPDDSSQNRSSVVGQGQATVSAFGGGDAVWSSLVSCVQDQFAAFGAVVTDVEPQTGPYIEAVIGGSPQEVGLPQGVGGVAPIDTFSCNIIDRAVVYVFSNALPNSAQVLCEVAAQEVAHALSLDHELLCEDPMTYLSGCGAKSFQDVAAQCGEFSARACECGRPSQNSVQILYDKLGPNDGAAPPPPPPDDGEPPEVSIELPSDGDVLPPNTVIEVLATADDDAGLASVELLWDHSGDAFPCPVSGQGFSCTVEDGAFRWRLSVGTGARTFRVRVRDLVGNVVETESRTISLDEASGPPPVADDLAPEVDLASPQAGATLPANSVIEVVAAAVDDVEVTSVELEWDHTGDRFACPLSQQAVSCQRQGSTYRWQVNVGEGTRTYRVHARDAAGNTSVTESRTVVLSTEPILPSADDEYEDNDTWDTATPLACSSGIDLVSVPGDTDWLKLTVAPGVRVSATVSSQEGAPLLVRLTGGPSTADIIASETTSSTATVEAVAEGSYVGVRVDSDEGGPYRVVATCVEDDADAPPLQPDEPEAPDVEAPRDGEAAGEDISARPTPLGEPRVRSGCASAGSGPAAPAFVLLGALFFAGRSGRRRRTRVRPPA